MPRTWQDYESPYTLFFAVSSIKFWLSFTHFLSILKYFVIAVCTSISTGVHFHKVCIYQVITLYTYSFICQSYLKEAEKSPNNLCKFSTFKEVEHNTLLLNIVCT